MLKEIGVAALIMVIILLGDRHNIFKEINGRCGAEECALKTCSVHHFIYDPFGGADVIRDYGPCTCTYYNTDGTRITLCGNFARGWNINFESVGICAVIVIPILLLGYYIFNRHRIVLYTPINV